jgi:hypothetical protein
MSYKKKQVPTFETDDKEAQYWDTHSPLEVFSEPGFEEVRVKVPKDRPITIRLDSESRAKLNRLAAERKIGASTFARLVIVNAIERASERPMGGKELVSKDIHPNALADQVIVREAMTQALDGNWQTAISLVREAVVSLPEEHRVYVNDLIRMVWLCIQKVSVKPLLIDAENSVQSWDYDGARSAVEAILSICQSAKLPLDYEHFSTRMVALAHATCAAASEWKSDVDAKLNRITAGTAAVSIRVEEISERLGMKSLPTHVLE